MPQEEFEDADMVDERCVHGVRLAAPEPCPECEAVFDSTPEPAPEPAPEPVPCTKDTNPKDGIGVRKVAFSFLPAQVVMEAALGMMEGGFKYGRHNYRVKGVRVTIYTDAIMRHLLAFLEGEDIDPESGLSHITKIITSAMVLRDAMLCNNYVDDRPPSVSAGWINKLNTDAASLVDRYPAPVAPYVISDS